MRKFKSNCLIESLKAKIKNPSKIKIHFFKSDNSLIPHFWWEDGKNAYEFVSIKRNRKYQVIYFLGYILKHDLNKFKYTYRPKYFEINFLTKKQKEELYKINKEMYPELF